LPKDDTKKLNDKSVGDVFCSLLLVKVVGIAYYTKKAVIASG